MCVSQMLPPRVKDFCVKDFDTEKTSVYLNFFKFPFSPFTLKS